MTGVGVGWIEPGSESALFDINSQLGSPERQQGSDYAAGNRRHAGQSGRARARESSHQNGLDLVVRVMCGENDGRSCAQARRVQPGISTSPGLGFSGIPTEGEAPDLGREAIRRGQSPHLLRYPGALRMDAVVGVSDDQLQTVRIPGPYQQVQQGHRVWPT